MGLCIKVIFIIHMQMITRDCVFEGHIQLHHEFLNVSTDIKLFISVTGIYILHSNCNFYIIIFTCSIWHTIF